MKESFEAEIKQSLITRSPTTPPLWPVNTRSHRQLPSLQMRTDRSSEPEKSRSPCTSKASTSPLWPERVAAMLQPGRLQTLMEESPTAPMARDW
eukprot:scaffold26461_cov101-Isochrysis_galbana.AAC.1